MIRVIGGGLAGSEAAWMLAEHGERVELVDMKPRLTPAHHSSRLCELVCSNSLKSNDSLGNACGLLKEEMRQLGSLTMEAAEQTRVPAGGALAVDRDGFAEYVTEKLRRHPLIEIRSEEVSALPREGIVATGPLTAGGLFDDISRLGTLHFFDASAPIVARDSLDDGFLFAQDRYGEGEGDYLNCPMDKATYELFVDDLLSAERATLHDFEKGEIFEGCMPVEVMAARGKDTLRFGPFKPVGLLRDGKRPYAVLQLRKENARGTSYGLVGCQTNLTFGEQKRVFSRIPALRNAEFERYGVMHRNTYLESPKILDADFSVKQNPRLFFAGQITGVEGYVESAASGMLAGIQAWLRARGRASVLPGECSVMGALCRYIARENSHFEPMNANYGILEDGFGEVKEKKERRRLLAGRALSEIGRFKRAVFG